MKTFASFALQCDVAIPKHLVNEIVHRGLFEPASLSCLTVKFCRTFYFLFQEVADI
jgi:hypothetical protein